MRKRTVGSWVTAAAVVAGCLSFSVPAGAEGGLTLEERVERLERKGELPQKECCDTSDLQKRLDLIEPLLQLRGVTAPRRHLALALEPLDALLQRETALGASRNTEGQTPDHDRRRRHPTSDCSLPHLLTS